MADKIRILEIDKSRRKEVESKDGKKSFKPVEDLWYDDTTTLTNTLEFDKTIAVKPTGNSKITLVQNANSHFFKQKNNDEIAFDKSDLENNDFEGINIVDRRIERRKSQLPDEIIKLREMSYRKEQASKEELLDKLNVDLKLKNNFKNYNLTSSDGQKPTKPTSSVTLEKDYLNKEIYNSEAYKKRADELRESPLNSSKVNEPIVPRERLKVMDEPTVTNEVFRTKEPDELQKLVPTAKPFSPDSIAVEESKALLQELETMNHKKHEIVPKTYERSFFAPEMVDVEEEFYAPSKYEKHELKGIYSENKGVNFLSPSSSSNRAQSSAFGSEFDSMNKSVIKKNSEISKFEESMYSTPIVENYDYTLDGQTDDLERVINDLEFGSTKIKEQSSYFDKVSGETTMLVNKLAVGAKEIKKLNLSASKFDDFESWFNSSKDVTKLAKLAKKEKRRMLKTSKGK
ncbi:hypothetical protein SCHIN_v1c04930 [Spiroplasma chinense]|uniref:Uncharacterized protein n=1 Tax=Spiroplasma chinense TaxID=216932 RepID=A0A5B9Y404_9MOLU|nr:hypothetical protein [Spiroplasma chinense]QEH61690.1 hypothetical protein SCHIN_v1c04930 [Spiroplasma chinense]